MADESSPRRQVAGWRVPSRGVAVKPGGTATAPGVAPGVDTVQLDPYLYPPPNAVGINQAANQGIVGAGALFPGVASFTIPKNCFGVVSTIDLLLDAITPASNVLWTLIVEGAAVPGFNPLTILGRSGAASVSKSWPGPLRIVIPLGGTVSWTIQDVDGAPYTAGVSYYGWFWPQVRDTGE